MPGRALGVLSWKVAFYVGETPTFSKVQSERYISRLAGHGLRSAMPAHKKERALIEGLGIQTALSSGAAGGFSPLEPWARSFFAAISWDLHINEKAFFTAEGRTSGNRNTSCMDEHFSRNINKIQCVFEGPLRLYRY